MKAKLALFLLTLLVLLAFPAASMAEEANRTVYRALIIGIDEYSNTPLRGCVNDANRVSAMLQAANEGGAFYQSPVVLLDPSETATKDGIERMALWGAGANDVTFFYFSGACTLNDDKTRVGLILRNNSVMEVGELEKMLAEVSGTKIVVFSLTYPQNRLKNEKDIKGVLRRVNDLIADTFSKAGEASLQSENPYHVLTMAVDYNTAKLVNSVSDAYFGMPTYFLSQACGYDYQYERPCDLLADESQDGAVSIAEAQRYVEAKMAGFQSSSGLTDIFTATKSYPDASPYPIVARRTHTDVVSVTLDRTQVDIPTENAVRLNAVVAPFNASDKNLIWTSSDLAVASVDQQGNVKALRAGDAVITASASNGISAFCEVSVRTIRRVEQIVFHDEGSMITTGAAVKLAVQIAPEDANETLFWRSSDEAVATVNQDGVVTGVALGSAEISVSTEGGVSARTVVQVVGENDVVRAIELRETSLTLHENESYEMEYRITPKNPLNKDITWTSSDDAVARVAENGAITGVSAGACVITAKASSGVTAECAVTVIPAQLEMTDRIELSIGKTKKIEYKVTPKGASPVLFISADESVALVDDDGTVKGINSGQTVVTGTLDNGQSAECVVIVDPVPVKEMKLNHDELKMTVGQIETLEAAVRPQNATTEGVVWKTSDALVANVDEGGVVTALKYGKAEITATAPSGKKATCKVEVRPIAVESIELNEELVRLVVGLEGHSAVLLTASVKPDNASERAVTWKSSDKKVAKVDEMGNVTAVGNGKAIITATPKDGGKVKAQCRVQVGNNEAAYDKPVYEKEEALFVSAKSIKYVKDELVVELYFYNRTKESMRLPLKGALVLRLADGTDIELIQIEQGDKKLSAGKSNTLEYRIPLKERDELRNLLLIGAQATIVPEGEALDPRGTDAPEGDGEADLPDPEASDFVDELT